jgi:hypothetical protein
MENLSFNSSSHTQTFTRCQSACAVVILITRLFVPHSEMNAAGTPNTIPQLDFIDTYRQQVVGAPHGG